MPKPKGRFTSIRGQKIAKEVKKEELMRRANAKFLRRNRLLNENARRGKVNLALRATMESPVQCNNSRHKNTFKRNKKSTSARLKNHLPSSKNRKDYGYGDKVPPNDSSFEQSKVVEVGESALLEKSIECSTPPQFKAMEGLFRKENNINRVNEHKGCPSSKKEGSNSLKATERSTNKMEDIVGSSNKYNGVMSTMARTTSSFERKGKKKMIDEGVQWHHSPSHERYVHMDHDEVGDDNGKTHMDVDTNKAEEAEDGSENHACVEGDYNIDFENMPCGTMKEQRETKQDIVPNDGDQSPVVQDNNDGDTRKELSIIMDSEARNDRGFPCLMGDDGKNDDIKSKARKESMQEKTNVVLGGDGDDDDDIEGVVWLRCGSKNKRKRYIITSDDEEVDVDYVDRDHVGIEGKKSKPKVVMLTDCLTKDPMPFISACVEQQCYYCSKPIDEPVWRGTLKVGEKEYTSLVGHLSTKSCEKVWKLSGSLQTSVEVMKLSRSKVKPRIWDSSEPSDDNIGLYFFPDGMRNDENLDQLINEVMKNDLVLQASIGEVEMLIFPSCMLPERYKTFQSKNYLWALFKRKEDEFAVAAKPPDSTTWCAQEEDKGKEHVSNQQDDADDVEPRQEMVLMKSAMPLESEGLVNLHPCMEKQGLEDIARGSIDDSLNCNSADESTHQVSASCVPVATNVGFQLKAPDERKHEDATCQSVHAAASSAVVIAEATDAANIPADHALFNSSMGVQPGRYFFAADRTPRVEKILEELHREVALVFAKPIGAGTGPGNIATTMQL